MISIVIPVYKNADTLPALLDRLAALGARLGAPCEAVFVVDGSPDASYAILEQRLPSMPFESQLLLLSRNFGSFPAIRAGLEVASGEFFAVMAADLQEPPELVLDMALILAAGKADVVLGTRSSRADPWSSRIFSSVFWWAYRTFVQKECPPGGVDVFACNKMFRDRLLQLRERNSTLVGLIFWLGFRRATVQYQRVPRPSGKSAWGFWRKVRYLLDSFYAFSDIPIRALSVLGLVGMALAALVGAVIIYSRVTGHIHVPGYSALAVIVLFFGGLNSLGLGLLGEYLWRTFENTKGRPNHVVAFRSRNAAARTADSETA